MADREHFSAIGGRVDGTSGGLIVDSLPFPHPPLPFFTVTVRSLFHPFLPCPQWRASTPGPGGRPLEIVASPQIQPAPKLWLGPKFSCDQLTLRKISNFDATRCQILRLKCTKFDFRWGSAPDPAGRAYSAPPNLLAVFNGPTSNER